MPSAKRLRPLSSFLRTEAGGAVVLLGATVIALLWANVHSGYENVWQRSLGPLDLRHWLNDGLMTLFFLVVGLEIKRELVEGELRDPRVAVLPLLAALAGLSLPAVIYLAFNAGGPGAAGWGIPVATDIAFAVGVLALLGRRVPAGLKVLLLTIAVADDIGAVIIIAIAYSDGIDPRWLAAVAGVSLLVAATWRITSSPWLHVPLGVAIWALMLASGVHATIAGVVLGLLTPAPQTVVLQNRLHPLSSYLVLPLFALGNAGVALDLVSLRAAASSEVSIGIVAGLLLGKTLGIGLTGALTARTRLGRLPLGLAPRHVLAMAPLGGIGFTVALFIAGLTFDDGPELHVAKVGVLAGSLLSAVVGSALLLSSPGRPTRAASSR
ncbi:MAG: Na+/H+ antiporter NhaA [Nitriliruptorales bacterium]